MSKEEQAADKLIKRYEDLEWSDEYMTEGGAEEYDSSMTNKASIQCALIDNQNTIDTLEEIRDENPAMLYWNKTLTDKIKYNESVRTILKDKLK